MKTFANTCHVEAMEIHKALYELKKAIADFEYADNSFFDALEVYDDVSDQLENGNIAMANLQTQLANALKVIL